MATDASVAVLLSKSVVQLVEFDELQEIMNGTSTLAFAGADTLTVGAAAGGGGGDGTAEVSSEWSLLPPQALSKDRMRTAEVAAEPRYFMACLQGSIFKVMQKMPFDEPLFFKIRWQIGHLLRIAEHEKIRVD